MLVFGFRFMWKGYSLRSSRYDGWIIPSWRVRILIQMLIISELSYILVYEYFLEQSIFRTDFDSREFMHCCSLDFGEINLWGMFASHLDYEMSMAESLVGLVY